MRCWLWQRLGSPETSQGNDLQSLARCFGEAGLGLTDKAREVLSEIWTIHYMGSAEYEFGALPNCIIAMMKEAEKGLLGVFDMQVDLSEMNLTWHDFERSRAKGVKKTIRIIGRMDREDDIIEAIRDVVKKGSRDFKENPLFAEALVVEYLEEEDKPFQDAKGWVDIRNNFMIFLDMEMCVNTFKVLFEAR